LYFKPAPKQCLASSRAALGSSGGADPATLQSGLGTRVVDQHEAHDLGGGAEGAVFVGPAITIDSARTRIPDQDEGIMNQCGGLSV
jgi:hypothetical protein